MNTDIKPTLTLHRTDAGGIALDTNDAALNLSEEDFFALLDDCITTLKTYAISVEQS